ncbi:hypothetical protein CEXT_528461 [Caerostris extrusa]|uniref:Uncharacterized protein n=1 Tax=Caerostris extrusa TaxID=172846 RepID=A0AAV4V901_CAEEX|nr:hypothetical protein CEXT_528461 [Caerostris extrusa]
MAKVIVLDIVLHKGIRMSGAEAMGQNSAQEAFSASLKETRPRAKTARWNIHPTDSKEELACAISPFSAFGAIALREDSSILKLGLLSAKWAIRKTGGLGAKTARWNIHPADSTKEKLECAIFPFPAIGAIALREDLCILKLGLLSAKWAIRKSGGGGKKTVVAVDADHFYSFICAVKRFKKKCNLGSNFIDN